MTKTHVLCDIDHVIADAAWRDYLLEPRPVDWDHYHTLAKEDEVHEDVVHLLSCLRDGGMTIVVVTGRPEKWEPLTTKWLYQNNVPADLLMMRPNDDYRSNGDVKIALITAYFGTEEEARERVAFLIEDNPSTVSKFAGIGIPVLKVVRGRKS